MPNDEIRRNNIARTKAEPMKLRNFNHDSVKRETEKDNGILKYIPTKDISEKKRVD